MSGTSNATTGFFEGQQMEAWSAYGLAYEKTTQSYRDLWKTLLAIHGVILGISAGIMSRTAYGPDAFLIAAWIAELCSIFLGLFVFKLDIDIESDNALRNALFQYDVGGLGMKRQQGMLDEKTLAQYMTASFVKRLPDYPWSDDYKKLAQTLRSKLPSSQLVPIPERKKIVRRVMAAQKRMVQGFYALSLLGFLLLLLSVLL